MRTWWPREPKHPMPPLPDELADGCDVRYLYNCQQCGLSVEDLQYLTFEQVALLMEMHEFAADAVAYAEEDAQAARGQAEFFS